MVDIFRRRDSLIAPAVSLLNTNQGDFELSKVSSLLRFNAFML